MVMGPQNCRLNFSFYSIIQFSSKHADPSPVLHGSVDSAFLCIKQLPRKSYLENSNTESTFQPSISQRRLGGGPKASACLSPGTLGCAHLLQVLVSHKGRSKPEKGENAMGLAQTRKTFHRVKCSGTLSSGSIAKDMLEGMSSAAEMPLLCWPCSPVVHPPVRVSPSVAPLLPAVRGAGPCQQPELGLWITRCLMTKAPGHQAMSTMSLLWQVQPLSSI